MKLHDRLLAVLPPLIVGVLVVLGLNHWSLWRAELWTYLLIGLPFDEMWAKLAEDFHPPGYFGGMWLLLDRSAPDWLIRLPSAVGAVGAVAMTGWFGRRWMGKHEGFLGALVLATSPFLVVWGGVARGYALLAFACGGLLVGAAALVQGNRVRIAAAGVFVCGTAAMYVHYASASALVAVALGVAAGLRARPDRGAGRWPWAIGALAAVGLAFAPWVLGPMQAQQVDVARIPRSLRALGFWVWPVGHQQPLGNWVLLGLAGVGAARLAWRRAPVDRVLLAWAAVAVVIPLVLSDRSDIQNKYYVESWFLPAWAMLVGVGAMAIRRGVGTFRARALALGAVLVPSAALTFAALLRLPGAPFEMLNGSTVYDVRREAKLLGGVFSVIPEGSFPTAAFTPYGRYFADIPTAPGEAWSFRYRDDGTTRSVFAPADPNPCAFVHAFYGYLTIGNASDCASVSAAIEASPEADTYPPFLLERARVRLLAGDTAGAVALAEKAGAADTGWSDPAVFLAQLHLREGDAVAGLAVVETALVRAEKWRNFFVIKELYAIQAELLQAAGRHTAARAAARCAAPSGVLADCDPHPVD